MRLISLVSTGLMMLAAATVCAEDEVLVGADWAETIISEKETSSGRMLDPPTVTSWSGNWPPDLQHRSMTTYR